jgi:hypothetical protein
MTRMALVALLFAFSGGACATAPAPRLAGQTAPARLKDAPPEKLAADREARRPESAEDQRRWGLEQARARAEQKKQQQDAKTTTRVDVVDPRTKAPRP